MRREDESRVWMVVGAFGAMALTGLPDASPAIQRRTAAHYLDTHAHSTLALDANLIVFCEPEQKEQAVESRV